MKKTPWSCLADQCYIAFCYWEDGFKASVPTDIIQIKLPWHMT